MALTANVAAAADQPGADAFSARLLTAQARLATGLIEHLSSPKTRDLAVSPASLAGAAAAVDLGASASLRAALHAALGFSKSDDERGDLAMLRERVNRLHADGHAASPLQYANSVVVGDGIELYPGVPLAFEQAGIDYVSLDFQAGDALEKINKRVQDQTAGLIARILDRIPSSASLIALNALYFNDRWRTPFEQASTKTKPFRRFGAPPIEVPTMHLPEGRYLFRRDARFIAIELPYAHDRFRMDIVTARAERPARPRVFRAATEWLTGNGFKLMEGELDLPRFDISSGTDLTGPLDALGLRSARLMPGSLAGFSAAPLQISRIIQRTELRLNEEGTEVAAATAIEVERGLNPDYVRMVVDRPFVFALRDAASGLILAAGYVGEPRATAVPTQ